MRFVGAGLILLGLAVIWELYYQGRTIAEGIADIASGKAFSGFAKGLQDLASGATSGQAASSAAAGAASLGSSASGLGVGLGQVAGPILGGPEAVGGITAADEAAASR